MAWWRTVKENKKWCIDDLLKCTTNA